jgi:hypothetical protein
MPTTAQGLGHYDQMLTNVSVAYTQSEASFIAPKVFPVVPVAKASDIYWKYPKGNFFRDDVQRRPMGGRPVVTNFGATTDKYICEEDALSVAIDDRERANQTNPMSVERSKVRLLTQQMLIHRDRVWAADFWGTGKWGVDVAGVNSGPTGDQAIKFNLSTSDPKAVIDAYQQRLLRTTGMKGNVLVLGSDAGIALENNPSIIDRIKYGNSNSEPTQVTDSMLAQLFKVDRVVRAEGVFNSAQEGVTESMGFIVDPKSILLAYAAPEPALEVPSAGYCFAWTGLLGQQAFSNVTAVSRWRDEPARSDYFSVSMAWDAKIVAPDLGVFFSGIVD